MKPNYLNDAYFFSKNIRNCLVYIIIFLSYIYIFYLIYFYLPLSFIILHEVESMILYLQDICKKLEVHVQRRSDLLSNYRMYSFCN